MPPGTGVARTSTAEVPAREAFAYWRDMISRTFVPLSAEPVRDAPFRGGIDHVEVGGVALSSVVAGAQRVRRTRSLVAASDGEYLLCSIQVRGVGVVEQDRRTARLQPGDLALYDSTRPYDLTFDGAFEQLVVQVPRELVLPASVDPRAVTATVVDGRGMGGPVGGFFRGLARTLESSHDDGVQALPHALALLRAVAVGVQPAPTAVDPAALGRERVVDHLRQHLGDASLDAATIADAVHVSRRTLYRLFDGEGRSGVMAELRRLRIERATELLRAHPGRPVAMVAHECGFASESAFYRAFRAVTGRTPRT